MGGGIQTPVLATPEFMVRVGHAGEDVKEMLRNVHLRLQGEARLRIPIFRFGSHRDDPSAPRCWLRERVERGLRAELEGLLIQ